MLEDLKSIFTLAGSTVGLITGGFVVWEKFVRSRPTAIITAGPLHRSDAETVGYLKLFNRSDRPIIVTWPTGKRANMLTFSIGRSARQTTRIIFDGHIGVAIPGNGEALFPVSLPPNWREIDSDAVMDTVIRWRFAQPLLWKRDRKIEIRITKHDYFLLLGEEG